MRMLFLPVLALSVVAAPSLAQERIGHEQVFHRQGRPGERVRVFTYTRFGPDCRPLPPPAIRITAAPAHGAVTTEPAQAEVRLLSEGAADCTGRVILGTGVFYTPAPGFRGVDRFEYEVLTTPTPRHDTAILDVR